MIPAKNNNCSLDFIIFCNNAAITIAVVKLSNTAEKKSVIVDNIHNNFTALVVLILSVIILKP